MQLLSRHGASNGDSSSMATNRESISPPREDVIQSGVHPADRAGERPPVPRSADEHGGRTNRAAGSKSGGASTSDEGEAPMGKSNTASAIRGATKDQRTSGSAGYASGTLERVDPVVPEGGSSSPASEGSSSVAADADGIQAREANTSSQEPAARGSRADIVADIRPGAERSQGTIAAQDSARTR